MGYCYDARTGKLCCDVCDSSEEVKKYKCPFGWCQAIALCAECRKKHPEYVSKEYHRKHGCEQSHQEAVRQKAEYQALLNAGKFVRCSALSHSERPDLNVKVIFRGRSGEEAYWMSHKTYDSIPILTNATPADFRKHGRLIKAATTDIYDKELEKVPA